MAFKEKIKCELMSDPFFFIFLIKSNVLEF